MDLEKFKWLEALPGNVLTETIEKMSLSDKAELINQMIRTHEFQNSTNPPNVNVVLFAYSLMVEELRLKNKSLSETNEHLRTILFQTS